MGDCFIRRSTRGLPSSAAATVSKGARLRLIAAHALLGLIPLLAACASAQSASTAGEVLTKPPWTREANEYVCRTEGTEKVRFKLLERHSWDEVEVQPPPGGVFAWIDSSGTFLVRFDFDHAAGSSTLRYYGADCGLRFTKELRWEPLTAHVLFGGKRLLLGMAKPYSLQWGDHWVPYVDILLFDGEGRQMLQQGPYETDDVVFVFYQSFKFSRTYAIGVNTPQTGPWGALELFLDLWKGQSHIYYINKKEGRHKGLVAITPTGGIRIYNAASLPPRLWEDLNDNGLIEGPEKPRPIYEYQFP